MKGEAGCFVYKVIAPIGVRSYPSTKDKYRVGPTKFFHTGDLVSVDLVIHGKNTKKGPFLRLSDGSGWIFERNGDTEFAEEVHLEEGLWSFYVDNEHVGLTPRNHPMDQLGDTSCEVKLKQDYVLRPMEKVFCDQRVTGKNGVSFYRIQDTGYPSWLFDTRLEDGETAYLMHPESRVRVGLFAFRALSRLGIRSRANVGDETKTGWAVAENEHIVCDIIRESPHNSGNGPFLRLADGTGWLFEHKYGERMMVEVPIMEGIWEVRIRNSNGIRLRKQPSDETKSRFSKIYAYNDVLICDRKIPAQRPGEASFYRVKGTHGWLFDRRDQHCMATEISEAKTDHEGNEEEGWTVQFVRGCAAAARRGIEEISFNALSRVISFQHPDGARINVYYTTKTVGTALAHPRQGSTQLFRRNCTQEELIEILKNPRVHTGHGYYRASKQAQSVASTSIPPSSTGQDLNVEEDFRNRVRDLDEDIKELMEQRKGLWDSIQRHQDTRVKKNDQWWEQWTKHDNALKAERKAKAVHEAAKILAKAIEEEQKQRTCSYCGREFVNPSAMQNHIRDVHQTYSCDICLRSFKNMSSLNQHKNATGHW